MYFYRSTFIYRRPKSTASSTTLFLRPLDSKVWYCLAVLVILILLLLKITFNAEYAFLRELCDMLEKTWSYLCLFVVAAFCQQGNIISLNANLGIHCNFYTGFGFHSRLISCRIVATSALLLSVLIYQFYSASIVSYLLMDPPRTVNSLEDLRDSSLRAGIEDILIDRAYVAVSTSQCTTTLCSLYCNLNLYTQSVTS